MILIISAVEMTEYRAADNQGDTHDFTPSTSQCQPDSLWLRHLRRAWTWWLH
jgi:hypothetical protein